MNERDLRNAFDHLKRDVIMNVQTDEQLEQITGRRRIWFSPAVTAFAGAAALALVVGGAVLALRPTESDPAAPATTVTTVTDTSVPPTTVAPNPDALPDLPAGTVLVAEFGATPDSSDGVVVVDGWTVTGDGLGGLLVDNSDSITRIAADGTETVLLAAADLGDQFDSAALRLEDMASVDGSMKAVVLVSYRPADSDREFTDIFQEIWLVDVETGAFESIWRMNAFESNITRVSVSAGRTIVSVAFEGGTYFEYLDTNGQPINADGPFYDEPIGVASVPTVIDQGVLTPGGSAFVYLEIDYSSYDQGLIPVSIVTWDLDAGTELGRIEVELTDGARPGRLDYDGVGIVLERYLDLSEGLTQLPPLRIVSLAGGEVAELDTPGRPSLVK